MDKIQKVTGYMEKKKKKMMTSYKKYWFVLEGRLLLYYRSKDEYEAISPCKGSINLGPPCTVKPCSSNLGVFQIETRSNTITLRTNDIEDQNRWMQAIMSALNPTNSPASAKLNHFRYSLDDINKNEKRTGTSLIQKLQKMGAQSYGGSMGQISRLAYSFGGRSSSQEPKYEESHRPKSATIMIENDQYCVLKSATNGSVEFRKLLPKSEEDLYECVRESDVYSVPNKSKSEENEERNSFLLDNEAYCSVEKTIKFPNTDDEVIYTEPKSDRNFDCNENSILIDNPEYVLTNNKSNESLNKSHEYLEVEYFQPDANHTFRDKFTSIRKKFRFKERTLEDEKTRPPKELKKSRSFINRVWRQTKKQRSPEPEEENIYETVAEDVSNKFSIPDESTIQILTELQSVLEIKKPFLEEKLPSLPVKHGNKNLDEILEELDKEASLSQKKQPKAIDKLINKFNNPEENVDVVLRRHGNIGNIDRYSDDELGQLLEELAKVTSAPIIPSGATMSLMNPVILNEEELLHIVPIRKRRLSEPDYDVPRPHKALSINQELEKSTENIQIQATRFFGSILPLDSEDIQRDSISTTRDSLIWTNSTSIAPDSLEPLDISINLVAPKSNSTLPIIDQVSYSSHHYFQQQDYKNVLRSEYDCGGTRSVDNDDGIYAYPKPTIRKVEKSYNYNHRKQPLNDEGKFHDVFEDSLEICTEISTVF